MYEVGFPPMFAALHLPRTGVLLWQTVFFGLSLFCLADGADAGQDEQVRFEIAAQPLASALDAYSAATGLEVFYDGALVAGQRSRSIHGVLEPKAALRELLAGSGLAARSTGTRSFTLVSSASIRVAGGIDQSYFATLQKEVSRALCGHAETRPRDVDQLLKLWIAASGLVERAQLFDISTSAPVSVEVAGALHGLSLTAPPADMPQPVTIAILAQAPGEPLRCGRAAAGPR
ncbi:MULTISPECIES: STN domain-containing protein [Bradyrhizobium]